MVKRKADVSVARTRRLPVKKRQFVIRTMKSEVAREKRRAVRGTKNMVNSLASNYRNEIYKAVKMSSPEADDIVKAVVEIRRRFKDGLKKIDNRDKIDLEPLRDDEDEDMDVPEDKGSGTSSKKSVPPSTKKAKKPVKKEVTKPATVTSDTTEEGAKVDGGEE